MTDSKTYQDLEAALIKAALGGSVQDKTISRKIGADGQDDGQTQTVSEHQMPANSALIEKILSERIGGPQDWC